MHAQKCTELPCEFGLRARRAGISCGQIEPGSLKNFAAQLSEGALTARLVRPQFLVLVRNLPKHRSR